MLITHIQLKKRTAGPAWFDLPAPPEADLPRLYREVEALRLRNQLDPKRFYRKDEGEGKGIKGLPKHFAVSGCVRMYLPSTTPPFYFPCPSPNEHPSFQSNAYIHAQIGTIVPSPLPFGGASSRFFAGSSRTYSSMSITISTHSGLMCAGMSRSTSP